MSEESRRVIDMAQHRRTRDAMPSVASADSCYTAEANASAPQTKTARPANKTVKLTVESEA
ncbi:MAG: hypothetical protein PVF13_07515, partial [Chromatiales bacterium]